MEKIRKKILQFTGDEVFTDAAIEEINKQVNAHINAEVNAELANTPSGKSFNLMQKMAEKIAFLLRNYSEANTPKKNEELKLPGIDTPLEELTQIFNDLSESLEENFSGEKYNADLNEARKMTVERIEYLRELALSYPIKEPKKDAVLNQISSYALSVTLIDEVKLIKAQLNNLKK